MNVGVYPVKFDGFFSVSIRLFPTSCVKCSSNSLIIIMNIPRFLCT